MKTTLLLLSIIFIGNISYSQISIDKDDFIALGDSAGVFISIFPSLDYHATGENMTWDFTDLTEESYEEEIPKKISTGGVLVNLYFGNLAPAKYKSSYFLPYDNGLPIEQIGTILANFMPGGLEIKGFNRIIKVANDKITYPGYSLEVAGQGVGIKSDTIELGYNLPFTYGDTMVSRAYTKFSFAPIIDQVKILQYRQKISVVDGYGTLATPYGNFEVVRIKHTITETDSVNLKLDSSTDMWFPIDRVINEYEWWGKDYKRPILKVETEGVFGSEIPRKVSHLNNNYLHVNNETMDIRLYPNPTHDIINLSSATELEKVSIVNTLGEFVYDKICSGKEITLDVSQLVSGIYTLQVITKKGTVHHRIVIE
ncbi:MAG: T9SS type A sorting domain-containing protein [Brumimicrobium sp.]|nr:T9SS type A sorting domain-containing protein [Brumimicrobium sp.]